jgi:putative endonuclease
MFYVYIIYSESADRYYIGHTNEPERRLEEHNNVIKNTYTFKYRPWICKACFEVSELSGEAKIVENYLKRMKRRKLIEKLINDQEEFEKIVELVRAIPTRRD